MKTDDLIDMLATGTEATDQSAIIRRSAAILGWSVLMSSGIMYVLLGIRSDIGTAIFFPMFWIKLLFAFMVAAAAFAGVSRLARPGRQLGATPYAMAFPVVLMWLLAFAVLAGTPEGLRLPLVLGRTWFVCPFLISLVSLPVFIAIFRIMKEMAPVHPALAGAAAGLFAGATGAVIYCLHCPEMAAPFLAVWYLAGMLIPAAVGALVGHRLLQW